MAAPDCRLVETTERVCSVQTILNTNNAMSVIWVNFSDEKQNKITILFGGKVLGKILVRKEIIANEIKIN